MALPFFGASLAEASLKVNQLCIYIYPLLFRLFSHTSLYRVLSISLFYIKIGIFLEFSCFFHDPVDVGDLISGSFAFSKTSLDIRKFMVAEAWLGEF